MTSVLNATVAKKTSYPQKKRVFERRQMIILHKAGIAAAEIACFTGRHISTVQRWIQRITFGENLCDRQRSGRPTDFSTFVQLKITAFFCQGNPLPGCNAMTLNWSYQYFNENPSFLGCPISISSIRRILRKHSLRPHLHKYFLQITDPDFFEIMPLLVDLYVDPPEYLFCFDECPGIQALRKVAPPLPAGKGKAGGKYSDPNHNRKGTKDLYAFFDVNSGKVFGECTDNHRVETLIELFKKHVASLPDNVTIHYICDNLSNHSCHEFCRVVAELSCVEYPEQKLETKKQRQQWLQKDDKRIIVHFTPKHGSWLNMVEIWFGIMGQKCLNHNSFTSVEELSSFLNDFIETWNRHYAHPFSWTYNGEGLHGKTVRRLITHIAIENRHMDLSFLLKQFTLMINLIDGYFDKVNIHDWQLLSNTIDEKNEYIDSIIRESDKPRIKQQAEELYPVLCEKLRSKLSDDGLKSIHHERMKCQN